MMKCFRDRMPDEVINELRYLMNIPASVDDPEELKDALATQITSENCVGPTSWQFRSRFEGSEKNEVTGNWEPTQRPMDSVGCTTERFCNWLWGANQATCNAGPANFCAYCPIGTDFSCNSISQFPECELIPDAGWTLSTEAEKSALCAQAGGNPIFMGPEPSNDTMFSFSRQFKCIDASKTTAAQCLNNADIDCTTSNPGNCFSTSCYKGGFTANDWNACNTAASEVNGNWGRLVGTVCVVEGASLQYCTGDWSIFYGRSFRDGVRATQAECSGACDLNPWDASYNQTTCEQSSYCTQPCSKCRSTRVNRNEGVCFKTATTDSSTCWDENGVWDWGLSVCKYEQYTTKATCEANAGYAYAKCEEATTRSGCANYAHTDVLQCTWK